MPPKIHPWDEPGTSHIVTPTDHVGTEGVAAEQADPAEETSDEERTSQTN